MPPVKKAAKKKAMTNEHKAALAEGRDQGRAVKYYLEALEAHKPKRGRKRTAESVQKRLNAIEELILDADPLNRLHLLQEQRNLLNEQAQMGQGVDLSELEDAFAEAAAAYGERKGITYDTWRELGVSPDVLRRAEISRR